MKKVSFRKNNRGFSLTELIVVIAVLAVLSSASVYSLGQIYATRTRKFANELIALMAECKVDALSGAKQMAYLHLFQEGDAIYGCLCENDPEAIREVKKDELGSNVKCQIVTSTGRSFYIGGEDVYLGFERSTGRLRPMNAFPGNDGAAAGEYVSQIIVSGGGNRYSIRIVASTGYYFVE